MESAAAGGPSAGSGGGPESRRLAKARPKWGTACIVVPVGNGRRKDYRRWLRRASLAIVRAQKEIRVLKALHWPDSVARRFLKSKGRELPKVSYAPLGFDPRKKTADLRAIVELLDPQDPIQGILRDTSLQYAEVVRMLDVRGTKAFYNSSARLYGHPLEPFAGHKTTSLDLAHHLDRIVSDDAAFLPTRGRGMSAEETAILLQKRMSRTFRDTHVRVEVSPFLTADAAAGASRIRIKKGRLFNRETVDYLEQHEGYVHIATTLNGIRQPYLPILGKASPRAVRANEGLAVFSEWASHTMTVRRMRRLVDRVLAIRMAEEGADFLQVYRNFLERGEPPAAAFDIARRVFRGGDLRGGAPFTKDASYLGDFLRIFNFARVAAKRRRMDLLELLFAGKVTVQDVPVLSQHVASGEIDRPRYLPPWLKDRNWLTAHMAVASFMDAVRMGESELHFEDLFSRCADPPEDDRRRRPRKPRKRQLHHEP